MKDKKLETFMEAFKLLKPADQLTIASIVKNIIASYKNKEN